ncbi:hypothetical protein D3C86_1681480 [compost metagenome]
MQGFIHKYIFEWGVGHEFAPFLLDGCDGTTNIARIQADAQVTVKVGAADIGKYKWLDRLVHRTEMKILRYTYDG